MYCIVLCCFAETILFFSQIYWNHTEVPTLGDPFVSGHLLCGHLINVGLTYFNVKLPTISGHLPNADTHSHLLVISTCYNGQCKQMPHFWWSFQPKIAGEHPNLRLIVRTKLRAVIWWPTSNVLHHLKKWTMRLQQVGYVRFMTIYDITS